jgi:transcriptional regulator with XRE-family HTH domain
MANSTSLAPDIRSQLESVRQLLGLSQGELADLAGISQGNVSNCLQGKPVKIDSLRRLLSAFASQVASASDKGLLVEQIPEFRKVVDAARKAVDGSVETSTYFARPGSPIPENAVNRIRRLEDRRLLSALDAPFTAAVVGPPECGKTTTLQLLVEEARRRGFAVVDFDSQILQDVTLEERSDDRDALLTARFIPELAAEVGRVIGERPPEPMNNSLELVRFLRETRSRRPAPPMLIAVDHTEAISLAIETLVQVCRTLDKDRGKTQMSWVLAAGDLKESHKVGPLSRLAPSPLIEMRWLSLSQVQEFSSFYHVQDERIVKGLWEWFLGQPSLTHIALDRLASSKPLNTQDSESLWQETSQEIQLPSGSFNQHLKRLRARLVEFWRAFGSVPPDASSFLASCAQDLVYRNLATRFGLLDPESSSISEFEMPRFYHRHYEVLLPHEA